jgi:hypothetical protein
MMAYGAQSEGTTDSKIRYYVTALLINSTG